MPQQTPRSVMANPPSEVIFPPELAVKAVIDEGGVVVNKAPPGMNVLSLLYEVPSVLLATTLK